MPIYVFLLERIEIVLQRATDSSSSSSSNTSEKGKERNFLLVCACCVCSKNGVRLGRNGRALRCLVCVCVFVCKANLQTQVYLSVDEMKSGRLGDEVEDVLWLKVGREVVGG